VRAGGRTYKQICRSVPCQFVFASARAHGWVGGKEQGQRRKSRRDEASYTYTYTGTNLLYIYIYICYIYIANIYGYHACASVCFLLLSCCT
jgi:hypothetical protein